MRPFIIPLFLVIIIKTEFPVRHNITKTKKVEVSHYLDMKNTIGYSRSIRRDGSKDKAMYGFNRSKEHEINVPEIKGGSFYVRD